MIEFDSASVRYDGKPVLDGLTLEVRAGETVVLLGASGSGKSTTLRLVNRLLEPSSGRVRVHGVSTLDWDPIELRRGIGYMIQEVGLFPHFTVAENVALVPRLLGWPEERRAARATELLSLVGLDAEGIAARYPRQLSGGQRQRVGVARALAADPPLLLCDEPFGAVDPATRRDLQRELRELGRGLGKTILFVTHDVREALALADRIALLEAGRLVFEGATDDFRRSDLPAVLRFRLDDPDAG